MLKTLNLKCPNCSANLEINENTDVFACGYCGASQQVQRSGGTVSLKLLTESISKVQIGTDKTAAELAIKRLKEEIAANNSKHEIAVNYRSNSFNTVHGIFAVSYLAAVGLSTSVFGNQSTILAVVVAIILVAGGAYLHILVYKRVRNYYDPKIEKLENKDNALRENLVRQKRIVNS